MSWGTIGIIVVALLIAGGGYYLLTTGSTPLLQDQQQQAAQQSSDINSIETDLNASANTDSSADLSNLEQSL